MAEQTAEQTAPTGSARTLWRLPVAAVGGGLLYLSFPPQVVWWTAVLAFALRWWVTHDVRVRQALLIGFVFGMTFFALHIMWIQLFIGRDYGPGPWLALAAEMAAFLAAAVALLPLVARLPGGIAWAAALVVLHESLRGRTPLNGFPWGRVAFGQVEGPFLPLAAVGGAPLVTFAVALSGFALARLALGPRRVRRLVPVQLVIVALVLAPFAEVGGDTERGSRTVAIVQGNAPDVGLALFQESATLRSNHLRVTHELAERIRAGEVPRPDLVVWPEGAAVIGPTDAGIDRAVADLGVPTLIGASRTENDRTENAVITWDPVTGPGEWYAKQELVPFGEQIPFRSVTQYLTPFVALADYTAGTNPGLLDVTGIPVGVGICYEVAYDWVLRESAADGAQLFVVPTNNAWYGDGEMTDQQVAMARLRAVEHGRAVAVPAISGMSAFIRPDGSVLQSTETYTAATPVDTLPLQTGTTPATVIGGYVELLLVLAAVGAGAIGIIARRRSRTATRPGESRD